MTAEWVPYNPCDHECKSRDSYCPPKNRFGCEAYKYYEREKEGQRKLLEYLIVNPNMTNGKAEYVSRWALEEMLKQLEKGQ